MHQKDSKPPLFLIALFDAFNLTPDRMYKNKDEKYTVLGAEVPMAKAKAESVRTNALAGPFLTKGPTTRVADPVRMKKYIENNKKKK